MAARGDLGLALHWVDLPGAVDDIADTANHLGKPWVLATQVFEGMAEFVMPTRAEICDLAHWLRRGCSAVLLSRETVFGPRPVPVVEATRDMIFRWGSQRDALSPPRGAVS
jgi:pyruvate kinase